MLDAGARCATHPSTGAVEVCGRCGSYLCADCMELEGFDGVYCAPCFVKVSPRAPASGRATGALVMALVAFSGCLPLAIPAVILAHMELGAIERGESPGGGQNLAKGALWVGYIVLGLSVLGGVALLMMGVALSL